MTTSPDLNSSAVAGALRNRALTRSMQMLSGIVAGLLADGQLHDMEIQFLRTWLTENKEVVNVWPGSAIARHLEVILEDGFITEDERAGLLKSLQDIVGNDFSETGSVSATVVALPFDSHVVRMQDMTICLTGEFLFGTRLACESISRKAGAIPVQAMSKKVSYLIVGTHVSANWVNTSYGRKIMGALELRSGGHTISIVSEKLWVAALS